MKNITLGIVGSLVAFATSALYGGPSTTGVAGVDVVIKQNPSKRAVTDAHGNFVLNALPPGSYTLGFRTREAKDLTRTAERRNPKVSTDKVTVASSYSIKVEGTKRSVNQSGLTSARLSAGIDIPVEVGAGAKVRGQVLGGGVKRMVWVSGEIGSHIPGHWAEADSKEAQTKRNTQVLSRDDLMDSMNRNNNMTDPTDPRNPPNSPLGAPR